MEWESLPLWKAERKQAPIITVVLVTEQIASELERRKVLERRDEALYVASQYNKNPAQVNIGDLLRVDDEQDIYPIPATYLRENFDIISGDTSFNQIKE